MFDSRTVRRNEGGPVWVTALGRSD
jgi:hypothetical protein